jgi:Plectin/S10 domain
VLQAEKDFNLEKHPEIDVPNLHVIKLMQSFKSKELVTERFAWRHYYWCGAEQQQQPRSSSSSDFFCLFCQNARGWPALQ